MTAPWLPMPAALWPSIAASISGERPCRGGKMPTVKIHQWRIDDRDSRYPCLTMKGGVIAPRESDSRVAHIVHHPHMHADDGWLWVTYTAYCGLNFFAVNTVQHDGRRVCQSCQRIQAEHRAVALTT